MKRKRAACAATAHSFDKFDDATIYCRNCGEQRVMDLQAVIAALPQPIYFPCPGPHYQPWAPVWWYTNGTVPLPQPSVTYAEVTVGTTAAGIYPDFSHTLKEGVLG